MGGGTPSLFDAEDLAPLFADLLPHCEADIEITLEANPGTIEHGQFADYHALGINRISLGVQSFNPAHLKQLGRIHHQADIFKAVDEIISAGFSNFNLDLMHGLPNQTSAEALDDLRQAISLNPSHLSWYQLTIEPNTYFANYPPMLPQDETLAEIEVAGLSLLDSAGFERYEISAFARNRQRSQHNLNYWMFGDYLGIGAGAHGKISLDKPNTIFRTVKPKVPKSYLQQLICTQMPIPRHALPFEFMMNALRLNQGIELALFTQQTGLPLDLINRQLEQAIQVGLLSPEPNTLKPTDLGYRFLNDLLIRFDSDIPS
jgi:oxygen-independent coproporphyrinogen-3 oxidase